MCFLWLYRQRSKIRPRAILEWKNLIEQVNLLSQHAPICAIMCLHGPTLQFVSRAETDKFRAFSISSLFSTLKVIFAGLPRKAFPRKQAYVRHQCFSVVAEATHQDSPKASPRADHARKRAQGERQGFAHLQTNFAFRWRAKEKVVRTSERKSCWTTATEAMVPMNERNMRKQVV